MSAVPDGPGLVDGSTLIDGPVLVVGAGLIGASVGMALQRAGVKTYLSDLDATAAHVAASRGAGTDEPAPDDIGLVVVATPPRAPRAAMP